MYTSNSPTNKFQGDRQSNWKQIRSLVLLDDMSLDSDQEGELKML